MQLANNRFRVCLGTVVGLAVISSTYLFGAYSHSHNLWPIELFRKLKSATHGQATVELAQYDSLGRLTAYEDKKQVECPVQEKDTGVLLVIGQSNAANYGQKKFTTQYPNNVVNYFAGTCYIAASPLLGATAGGGEFITPLADQLISKGTYKKIVIIAAGVGGAPISRWQRHGDLNKSLIALTKEVQRKFNITDVIWHQGESDAEINTTTIAYVSAFRSLFGTLNGLNVKAPIFLAIASWCPNMDGWTDANPVATGQRMLVDNKTVFLGADTDILVGLKDRKGCHFAESGQIRAAKAFADSMSVVKNPSHFSTVSGLTPVSP